MSEDHHTGKSQLTPLQRFLSSRLVTGVGMFISKYLPPPIGYAVGDLIAGLINWLKPDVYWIVYANLCQVLGPEVDDKTLHRLVRQVFHNNARNDYGLWHLVGRGPETIRAAVHITPDARARLEQALQRGKGVIIVGTHTGNFNLGILALAAHGLEIQVLGLAAPPAGGFDLMDRMRARAGVRLTSISVPALREAIKRLRAGGVVLTGVDRPVDDAEQSVEPPSLAGRSRRGVEFFGRLAQKHDMYIVAPVFERLGHVIYNTAALVGPDGRFVGKYRKVCLPRTEYLAGITPGGEYPVFQTRFGKLGMMICYDVSFPEVARGLANNGADADRPAGG